MAQNTKTNQKNKGETLMPMIPVPLLAFVILIVSSIPLWILLLTWLVMKIIGSACSSHEKKKMKKHQKEIDNSIKKFYEKNEINND